MLLYEKIKFLQKREVDALPAGVVFVLDLGKCQVPSVSDFYLLDKLPARAAEPLSKVEEFKLQEGLRPTGLLAAVTQNGLVVFDFDQAQDKKASTAHVVGVVESEPVVASSISEDHQQVYLQSSTVVSVVRLEHTGKWTAGIIAKLSVEGAIMSIA